MFCVTSFSFVPFDEVIWDFYSACDTFSTQPRRISAVSVAERVAYERGEEPGSSCGYSVRFESMLPRPHASVMFCTVGGCCLFKYIGSDKNGWLEFDKNESLLIPLLDNMKWLMLETFVMCASYCPFRGD